MWCGVIKKPLLGFEAVGELELDGVALIGPGKRARVVEADLIP